MAASASARLGYFFIVLVALDWILSSYLVQELEHESLPPLLITTVCNALFLLCLFVHWAGKWCGPRLRRARPAGRPARGSRPLSRAPLGLRTARSAGVFRRPLGSAPLPQAQPTSNHPHTPPQDRPLRLPARPPPSRPPQARRRPRPTRPQPQPQRGPGAAAPRRRLLRLRLLVPRAVHLRREPQRHRRHGARARAPAGPLMLSRRRSCTGAPPGPLASPRITNSPGPQSNTILSSTSTIWTFLLSVALGLDGYSLTKLLCVLVTFAGVAFVTLAGEARRERNPTPSPPPPPPPATSTGRPPLAAAARLNPVAGRAECNLPAVPRCSAAGGPAQESSEAAAEHTAWGDFLAVASALLYAVYTAIIKVALPTDERVSMARLRPPLPPPPTLPPPHSPPPSPPRRSTRLGPAHPRHLTPPKPRPPYPSPPGCPDGFLRVPGPPQLPLLHPDPPRPRLGRVPRRLRRHQPHGAPPGPQPPPSGPSCFHPTHLSSLALLPRRSPV